MKLSCVVSLFIIAEIAVSVECSIYDNLKFYYDDEYILHTNYLSRLSKNYQKIYNQYKTVLKENKQKCSAFNGTVPTTIGRLYIDSSEYIKTALKNIKAQLAIGDDEKSNTQGQHKEIPDGFLYPYLSPIDNAYKEYDSMETRTFTRTGLTVKIQGLMQIILKNNTFPLINALEKLSNEINVTINDKFANSYKSYYWRKCTSYELMLDVRLYLHFRLVTAELRVYYMTLQMCLLALFSDEPDCDLKTTNSLADNSIRRIKSFLSAVRGINDELQPECDCFRNLEEYRHANYLGEITNFVKIPDNGKENKIIRVFTNLTEHICFHLTDDYHEYMWEICYGDDMNTQDVIRKDGSIYKVVVIDDRNRFQEPNVMKEFTITCSNNTWTIFYTQATNPQRSGELSFEENCELLTFYTLTSPHVYNKTLIWILTDVGAEPKGVSPLVAGFRGCYCRVPENEADFKKLIDANSTRIIRSLSSNPYGYVSDLLQNNFILTKASSVSKTEVNRSSLVDNGWAIYSGCLYF